LDDSDARAGYELIDSVDPLVQQERFMYDNRGLDAQTADELQRDDRLSGAGREVQQS
jgi:hypothetical protein